MLLVARISYLIQSDLLILFKPNRHNQVIDMEYTIPNITSLTSLRKMAKDVGAEDFIKFAEKVMTISDEVETQLKEAEREREEKKNKLKEHFAQIQANGFTGIDEAGFIDLFLNLSKDKTVQIDKPSQATKAGSEPKYSYKDEAGNDRFWSGRGRIPGPMQKKIAEGSKKEDFLIKKD
ncbi:H-NS histone family protein [Salmonella enterica]|nr:hypothetical protein [Salmonella enterica subsp. salamae]ECL1288126.1 hypothetical protein [Salmonella enterica]EEA0957372.1 H-NS histone family protein [Salmonella enterica]